MNQVLFTLVNVLLNMSPSPLGDRTIAKAMENTIKRMRLVATKMGFSPNPVGSADAKTGTPGTYRPIKTPSGVTTCPQSCPLFAKCYATEHHVNIAQQRASAYVLASLSSAAIAIATAALFDTVARLHVSGDNYDEHGQLDVPYLHGLCELGQLVRSHYHRQDVVAFGYTHVPENEYGDWLDRLVSSGVHFRISDKWHTNGAVVASHRDFKQLKAATGLKLAKCPAQLTHNSIPCRTCKICWERPDVTVMFDPHGSSKKAVMEATKDITSLAVQRGAALEVV